MASAAKLQQFISITGAPEGFAQSFLASNGWDVGRSVEAFLSNQQPTAGQRQMDDVPLPQQQVTERLIQPVRSRRRKRKASSKAPRWDNKLAAIFKPPSDLTFDGTFEETADEAAARSFWILVNLQDEGEFISHRLNRDVWGKDNIKDFVRSSFVFWQQDKDSEYGKWFRSFYDVKVCPFVAIVNPRSRRVEKQWEDMEVLLRSGGFFQQMTTFLEDKKVVRPVKRSKAELSAFDGLSEEDALKRAIQESLKPQEDDGSDSKFPDSHSSSNGSTATVSGKPRSQMGDVKKIEIAPEPPSGPLSTTLQIRFPSQFGGKQLRRRFRRTAAVDDVLEFVWKHMHVLDHTSSGKISKEHVRIRTTFPRRLVSDVKLNLSDAKLLNAAVVVEIEDG
eukprot:CAMPEP_0114499090 /NCGR_PEP_ID=MMETSP0109-20121206/7226_1 /TAXON_ID=29199 /ORGANISM="Chlorarachnion reptans, Strain CCCM449" /LENGTH=390 /DNA_ID=CAMNT_0001676623 /DNA_START=71 /DNA_END=1243 /DNA_ORIENTATION=+